MTFLLKSNTNGLFLGLMVGFGGCSKEKVRGYFCVRSF